MAIEWDTPNLILILIYIMGFFLSLSALFQSRTPQGSMAWILSLMLIPFLSIPFFLVFGRKKIFDYPLFDFEVLRIRHQVIQSFENINFDESLFSKAREVKLLINGDETFEEMISTIKKAQHFIFLQMYIFRTDSMGTMIAEALIQKAHQGVSIYVLYERLGIRMSRFLLRRMKKSGISLSEFSPTRLNKFQLNFRNHRKLLLVDGEWGFWGGINIGDEYLGISRRFKLPPKKRRNWRDTNLKITGPVVKKAMIDFVRDWNFSQKNKTFFNISFPHNESPVAFQAMKTVILENTGPYEFLSSNYYQHIELFNKAKFRLWMANPYVVPPQGLVDSLLLAQRRGVDVRLIVPELNDNFFVSWAMEVYLEKFVSSGIKVFKYKQGMMHQKVVLIDDEEAMIGSSNLDYRSMHINFENNIIVRDAAFLLSLEFILRQDMKNSNQVDLLYFKKLTHFKKIRHYLCNSLAPIL